ncbi:hypothetical protein QFC22_005710 [Naganishia vaughanmartiniae]|uniref:Uncharacterized protein n=1 Tax=Naganishia vaughanmartiniae TaxID=1424756 RepID=A0ACC2WS43_9TREE|nr:hypothetical protein QFC22_005710 [Naganishia vaughanmartiniae]
MWSYSNTASTSAFASSSSQISPVSQGVSPLQQTTVRPGRLDNLARAIESEFWAGQSTTDTFQARSRDRATSSTHHTLSYPPPPPACSSPEYGLDPIEGSFVLQGLRPKQGTHAFSSRFQNLLERKLQAELAAKEQQIAADSQIGVNLEQSSSNPFAIIGSSLQQAALYPSCHDLSACDTNSNFLHPYPLGLLKERSVTQPFVVHDNMPGHLRDENETFRQLHSATSHYSDLSSCEAYASPSVVPPNILPPAVQTAYVPAPYRSQHYQRLLAAKLANSGQTMDPETTTTNDAAASFMQNWGDHSLDPNYPTPQEMSFLPSSQSPLYQLFTSGNPQDGWQDGASFPESTVRPVGGPMGTQTSTSVSTSQFETSAQNTRHNWPAIHLQRSEVGGPANVTAPPYMHLVEPVHKFVPWMNPYAQAAEDGDAAGTTSAAVQSSRAPAAHQFVSGQETQQRSEVTYGEHGQPDVTASASSAAQPVKSEANDLQASMSLEEENAQSPDRAANTTVTDDGAEDGDEPKKAVLACHFCRGRKLKCDGTRPTCAHCDKRGLECSYDEKIRRRGPGKRKREQMAILAAAEGQMDEDGTPLLHKLLAPKLKAKRGRKPKNRTGEDGADLAGVGEGGDLLTASSAGQRPHAAGSSASSATTMDVPYTRPPNPYLPSYFIPSDHHLQQQQQQQQHQHQHLSSSSADYGMHGHSQPLGREAHDRQQRSHPLSLLHHPSQRHSPSGLEHGQGISNGQNHPQLDPKLSHIPPPLPPSATPISASGSSSYVHSQTYTQHSYHPASAWPEDMDMSGSSSKRQRTEYHHQDMHGGW